MFFWFCFYYIVNIGTRLNIHRETDIRRLRRIYILTYLYIEKAYRETNSTQVHTEYR